MKFVQEEFSHTLEIKKSKFITYICPYDEFKNMMQRLKDEHPKARHFVYAYRFLNEFGQIVENSSDDGEPKGTSGRPSLKVLDGNDLINTAVIIIRYFGGIKLGTGGLVRAYSDAVNLVINESTFKTYEDLQIKEITLQYSEISKMEYKLAQLGINIKNKDFSSNVLFTLESTQEKFDLLFKK